MNMQPVQSSNIAAIGYDDANQKLAVVFNNGGIYHYDGVPAAVHQELLAADSVGSAFHRLVKGGGFTFTKIQ